MKKYDTHLKTHRVITMLDRNEIDFLDKLGKDALFSTGHKLSYNDILKGLIDFAIDIGLSGENAASFQELKDKLTQEFPKYVERLKQERKVQDETPSA